MRLPNSEMFSTTQFCDVPFETKEPPRIMDVRGDLRRSVKDPPVMSTQTPSQ
jgi:hypothetical protein